MTPDEPIPPEAGRNASRERIWGVVGGILGSLLGGGSALIAVYIEGASWAETPYPAFFARRRLLTYDLYLLTWLALGLGLLVAALAFSRRGRYPRTDAFGAGLIGLIVFALSTAILFTRLVIMVRGG